MFPPLHYRFWSVRRCHCWRVRHDRFQGRRGLPELGKVRPWPTERLDSLECLFHRLRRAEQRAIAAKTSDNLQAERHTFVIDAARYGNRGIGGERDYIRKREPVIVVVERLAIHFREIKLRPREWRYWRRRSEDNIVIAERLLK